MVQEHVTSIRINPVLMVAVIAAIADLATTAAIFALGGSELNPFMSGVPFFYLALLHGGVVCIAAGLDDYQELLRKRGYSVPLWSRDCCCIVVSIVFFAAAIWNIHELWSYAVALAYTVVF